MIKLSVEQLKTLAAKAGDKNFRAAAMKDPRAALESVGIKLPAGLAVNLHVNGASEFHVVLPQKGDAESLSAADPHVAKVFEKSWADAAFKAELLKNPVAAIKAATSQKLPSGLKIVAHENTANALHVVLPHLPAASGELSDNDLEAVAGGKAGQPGYPFPGGGATGPGQIFSNPQPQPTGPVSYPSYPGGFGGAGGFGGRRK